MTHADLLALIDRERAEGYADWDRYEAALVAMREVVEMHRPFGIYEECGHDHSENAPGVVVVEELDKPYTCEEGLLYRTCYGCGTTDGMVREDTEDVLFPCPTYRAILAWAEGMKEE